MKVTENENKEIVKKIREGVESTGTGTGIGSGRRYARNSDAR